MECFKLKYGVKKKKGTVSGNSGKHQIFSYACNRHAIREMGSTKDRNGMDLTEAEGIKKRWQENTEELYKKDLHDPDNPQQCDHSPRARHPGM